MSDEERKDPPISLRLDPDTIDRIDNMVEVFRKKLDPRMSRSNIIRILIAKGLDQMETKGGKTS